MQFAGPGHTGGGGGWTVGRAASQQGMLEGNRVKAVPSPALVPGPFLSEGQQEVRKKGRGGRRERVGGDGVYQVAGGLPAGQQLVRVSLAGEAHPGKKGGRGPTGPPGSHTGEPSAGD